MTRMLLERDGPLNELLATARNAAAGRGGTVLLEGEAGIGKTSLLREFAAHADKSCRVLWGWCEALFTPRPLGPLQDMAQALDPQIAALLEQTAAPERLFPTLLNALQHVQRPTVLVFEDVHWADNATLDLVKYLGRRIALVRAVLVLSVRSDEVGADHPLTHVVGDLPSATVTRIALGPLSADAVVALAREGGARRGRPVSHHRGQPVLRHRTPGEQRERRRTHPGLRPRRRVVAAVAAFRERARGAGNAERRAGERGTLAGAGAARRRGRSAGRPMHRLRASPARGSGRRDVPPRTRPAGDARAAGADRAAVASC